MTQQPGAPPPGEVSGGSPHALKAAVVDANGSVSCPDHPKAVVKKRGSRYRCSWQHNLDAPSAG
jgi:hypothetical protein